MTTKERLKQFIDLKGFSERKFSKEISSSETYFTSTKSIGSDKLEKISEAFPELNMDWVITGRGKMHFESTNKNTKIDPISRGTDEQEKYIRSIVQDELNKKNERKGNDVVTAGS